MPEGTATSRPVWIGTSWKMNKTLAEAREWTAGVLATLAERPELMSGIQPFVIPPLTALTTVRELLGENSPVLLGAQNAHWEDAGAWTGEVSVPQAADAGAQLIEIGHSERREHFGETVETTRLKVAATLRHDLTPLLCIGEPLEVHDAGGSAGFILDQVRGAVDGLPEEQLGRILLAYEPIWAIGEQGRPATPADLADPVAALQAEFGASVRAVLYGGSVNTDNAADLLAIPGIDGLFVGRTAWELDGFRRLLEIAAA
ncbi:triose-phosphate isomerase [Georgenia deserti]|uniref:Triosephosphate isomerase n=1 Tax=Georgenia deserti TaxID=2093781 RepID=A0ABW4L3G0_9MICO